MAGSCRIFQKVTNRRFVTNRLLLNLKNGIKSAVGSYLPLEKMSGAILNVKKGIEHFWDIFTPFTVGRNQDIQIPCIFFRNISKNKPTLKNQPSFKITPPMTKLTKKSLLDRFFKTLKVLY